MSTLPDQENHQQQQPSFSERIAAYRETLQKVKVFKEYGSEDFTKEERKKIKRQSSGYEIKGKLFIP